MIFHIFSQILGGKRGRSEQATQALTLNTIRRQPLLPRSPIFVIFCRNLEDIWRAFDTGDDGILGPAQMGDLVKSYLEAMRQRLPGTLQHLVSTITVFFAGGKNVDALTAQLMASVNEKILPKAETFIGGMLADYKNIGVPRLLN